MDREPVNKKRKRDDPSESFYVSLKTWYKIVILPPEGQNPRRHI